MASYCSLIRVIRRITESVNSCTRRLSCGMAMCLLYLRLFL